LQAIHGVSIRHGQRVADNGKLYDSAGQDRARKISVPRKKDKREAHDCCQW